MKEFDELVSIFKKLRGPDGCPWDKVQTHESILQCAVDEVYEFLEAVEEKDDKHMCEELGDLLLQIVFHSQMAWERNAFSIADVIQGLNKKLLQRHPHVFGSCNASAPDRVIENWEEIKQKEKPQRTSIVDGIPKSLPALFKAEKLQRKVAKVGFDWTEPGPVLDKVQEEFAEFRVALESQQGEHASEELGDILFALVNVARHHGISAEEALRQTIRKFKERFQYVEAKVRKSGKKWNETNLDEMDQYWEEAKQRKLNP